MLEVIEHEEDVMVAHGAQQRALHRLRTCFSQTERLGDG
jgi:hypothetical protein